VVCHLLSTSGAVGVSEDGGDIKANEAFKQRRKQNQPFFRKTIDGQVNDHVSIMVGVHEEGRHLASYALASHTASLSSSFLDSGLLDT
jgi:hypothetical protein